MFAARQRYNQLTGIKQNMTKQSAQPAAQPLDPRTKNYADAFVSRTPWFDAAGEESSDQDSRMLARLDKDLHAEGWNPATEEYWTELESRGKKYLPHRYNSGYNAQQGARQRIPVSGGSRDSAGTKSGNASYRLSAERVNALKDAGVWEDAAKRADAIRRFKEFDAQASNSN